MTVYFECVVRFNVNKTLLKETDKKKKKSIYHLLRRFFDSNKEINMGIITL